MISKISKGPKCSIIIRSFNEEKHLGALLERIQIQSFQDYEIILVDSGSEDKTLDIAQQYPVRIVHIAAEEFTFGRSLNLGIIESRGEIVVIASAHVLPKNKDWLSNLIAPFENGKLALSYGMQRGGAASKFSESQHWTLWFPEESNRDQEQPFCNNANAALRRAFWDENPFDENLTGLEDIAWASWAREQGYRIAYVAEAEVIHLHDESPAQITNRHRREAIALRSIMPNSRFTLWNFATLFARKSFTDMAAAYRQGVLLKEIAGISSYRFFQYMGTYKGYHEKGEISPELKRVLYFSPAALEPQASKAGNGKSRSQNTKMGS